MSSTIKIHDLKVEPDTKEFGYLQVKDSPAITVKMPLGIVNGAKPGPIMCITGGIYGTEWCGIESASRLYRDSDPMELSGALLIVPVINYSAFQFRTPMMQIISGRTPFDWNDVNRSFPGSSNGTVSQVIAHTILQEVLLKAKYHIDFRGGDLPMRHAIHTIYCHSFGNDALAMECESLAKLFGMPYVMPGNPNVGHTGPGTMIYEALQNGIVSFISESGIGVNPQPKEEFVQWHLDGTRNVMKHLGMIEGSPKPIPENQKFLSETGNRVLATKTGVFHMIKDFGIEVKKGESLGKITDLAGETIENIVAPIDGYIHCVFPKRLVRRGDPLFNVFAIQNS